MIKRGLSIKTNNAIRCHKETHHNTTTQFLVGWSNYSRYFATRPVGVSKLNPGVRRGTNMHAVRTVTEFDSTKGVGRVIDSHPDTSAHRLAAGTVGW
jgi:hypothetical protein